MASLHNLDLEKQFLSAAIRNPDILAECPFITEKDFDPETNRVVFDALRACIASGTAYSKFLLIDRLNSLNIKIGGILEPATYINSIELIGVNDKAAVGIGKEIKRWSIRREMHETAKKLVELTAQDIPKGKSEPLTATELVAEATKVFNDKIHILGGFASDDPEDLYGAIRGLLEKENVYDTNSILSPWPLYNDFFGGFDAGQVYSVCARAKAGKSTWVMSMLDQIMRQDDNFAALIMDTELTIEEVGFRLVSSLTGVKEYYIRHKHYQRRGYAEMKKKIEAAYEMIDPFIRRIDHKYCGGMDWSEQESIIRRWVAKKKVKEKKKVMVVYDYLKFDGEEFNSKMGRDLVIGKKANGVKNLAKELQIPIWALVQASRENEDTKAGAKISNGSVVADSDMISRLFSNVYLLQKLSDEQRVALGQASPKDATHALLPIYTRQLGPEELGKCGLVKYQEMLQPSKKVVDRWRENFICYSFHNFRVSEVATFKDLYERSKILGVPIQPEPPKDDDNLPKL